MTTTINADNVTGGAIVTGDASGQLGLQAAGVTKLTVSSSGVTLASALPIASGGTGTTSTTFANLTTNVTGTLPIANGGTNSTATPTAGGAGYGTGTAHAYTAAGTSGQLLQSNGASAPTWVTASSGAMTLLSTVTASNSATVDIETTFSSTYDQYMLVGTDINTQPTGNESLTCRLKIGGSYITTATYFYHNDVSNSSSALYVGAASSPGGVNRISITPDMGATAGDSMSFVMFVHGPANTTFSKFVEWVGRFRNSGDNYAKAYGQGGNTGTGALTGVRFLTASGSVITSGKFRLYGIANS